MVYNDRAQACKEAKGTPGPVWEAVVLLPAPSHLCGRGRRQQEDPAGYRYLTIAWSRVGVPGSLQPLPRAVSTWESWWGRALGASSLGWEQTLLPWLHRLGPWLGHGAASYPQWCLAILGSAVVPGHHPRLALAQGCLCARTAWMSVPPFIGSFVFIKIVAFSRLFFTNFSLYFSNSKPPAGKFPLQQQDLLNEKGCYYWGKQFFQSTEPNASQQQKKEKSEKDGNRIKLYNFWSVKLYLCYIFDHKLQ